MPDPRAYRRLAALVRDQITSGMIAPGAQLPPIGDLRRQHGHSRQTVTKAMGVLQDEGLGPLVDAGPCAQRIPLGPRPGDRSPAMPPKPLAGATEPAGPCQLCRL